MPSSHCMVTGYLILEWWLRFLTNNITFCSKQNSENQGLIEKRTQPPCFIPIQIEPSPQLLARKPDRGGDPVEKSAFMILFTIQSTTILER